MKRILVIHGPNLNLLGERQPQVYGRTTLKEINTRLKRIARDRKYSLTILQSNIEGRIVEAIAKVRKTHAGILINPAAYTHTSVAIRDAIMAANLPTVEVHLSNIQKREEFRHRSLITPVATGTILGFGADSYYLGLQALIDLLQ
jgi:3-dehydroquinate dehydratase-2